ncbi:hypothetical protein RJJ65_32170 [Rhizobium hidalgonense]|uniref:Uncharacterized protein n=1 Tax=Rhizobium hidalgonense TaxID=1538159 RepID=A0AAJ2GWI6_9HYPH|nr:hypothetical protein [Rhizobium hidalgonense]MDR9777215.1 hypothetical protein [Rhizobium hidalgonense]
MRLNITDGFQKKCERIDMLESWHKWFAWHPIRVNTWQIAWLETIERRGHWYSQLGWCFEYREIQAQ